MRSIAVTKPDMGVLPRERVLLSPFGMLAQAFAQDVLARAEQREGLWPFLPLELLEEGGESAPPAAPAPVNLQVDLRLALEALRREGGETQQERAAQRIVERVIQMHSLHTAPGTGQDGKKTGGREGGSTPGAVRQAFYQSLIQHISITPILLPPASLSRGGYALASGARPWRRVLPWLQTAEKEGQTAPRVRGARREPADLPPVQSAAARPSVPGLFQAGGASALPPEELALQEIRGDQGAGSRMAPLLTQTGLERLAERALSSLSPALPHVRPLSGEPGRPDSRSEVRDPGRLSGYEAGARRGGAALPTEPSVPGREAALRPQRGRAGQGEPGQEHPAPQGSEQFAPGAREAGSGAAPGAGTMSTAAREIRVSRGPLPGRGGEKDPHRRPPEGLGQGAEGPYPTSESRGEWAQVAYPAPESRRPGAELLSSPELALRQETEEPGVPGTRSGEAARPAEPSVPGREAALRPQGGRAGQRGPGQEHPAPQGSEQFAPGAREAGGGVEKVGAAPGAGAMSTAAREIRVSRGPLPGRGGEPGEGKNPLRRPPEGLGQGAEGAYPALESRGAWAEVAYPTLESRRQGAELLPPPELALRQETEEPGVPGTRRGEAARPAETSVPGREAALRPQRGRAGQREPGQERPAPQGSEQFAPGAREAGGGAALGAGAMSIAAREIRVSQGPLPGRGGEPGEGKKPFRCPLEGRGQGAEGAYPALESRGEWAQAAHLFPESRRPGAELLPPPELALCKEMEEPGVPRIRSGESARPAEQSVPGREAALRPQGGRAGQREPGQEHPAPQGSEQFTPGAREAGGGAERSGALSAFRPLTTSAREIRMKGARAPEGTHALTARQEPAWSAPFGEIALVQPARQEPPVPPAAFPMPGAERSATLPAEALRASEGPEPLALDYGPAAGAAGGGEPGRGGGPVQPRPGESDYLRSLPDWAQRFLRSGPAETPAGRSMGVARDIASLPRQGDTVAWTAPDYRPPQAATVHREKGGGEGPQTRQEVRVSDAEIQRTADKVYRMIEERLRRERRRLGF